MDWSSKKNKRKIENYKYISYGVCITIFIWIGIFTCSNMDKKIVIPLIFVMCILSICFSLVCVSKLFKWKIEKDRKRRVHRFR